MILLLALLLLMVFSIVFPNSKDYHLPGTDFTVRKNDMILFPNEAFHK